jgi:aryl-alcohol dehydrogenase-like predicted oxidoreductase
MQQTFLGNSGLKVSAFCLGTMTFGTEWGWGADEAESRRIFDTFVEAGGNFIDTADAYTQGTSERFVGEFIAGRRDRFVVASKYTISTDPSDPNAHGNGRKHLRQALDASLKRLRTDHIDLYQVHMWDGFTPIEETMRALDAAVRAGKVLHVGYSDVPAWMVARADALAECTDRTRPVALQLEYNLAQRDAERELIPMARSLGLSVLDWSPLAGGALTGKPVTTGSAGRVASGAVNHFDQYRSEHTASVVRAVSACARELGATPAQVALAWLRQSEALHIPIVGARSAAQLQENLKAAALTLPADAHAALDAAGAPQLGFPHDFLRLRWPAWFGDWPRAIDPRVRPASRRALALDL